MAVTKIADILKPENWEAYQANPTAAKTAFWASGIIALVAGIILPSGGGTVNMPFFADLTGDEELLSDSAPLTAGNITTSKDVAAVIGRGRAFGANDLAGVLSGADPIGAMMALLDGYQMRQSQAELINMLGGAFAAASMSGNVSDISGNGTEATRAINQTTFIDACQLLGDAKDAVSAVAMHSAVEAYLAKQQMIVYETTADKSERIAMYMGKRVIVDDGLPVGTGTYTTYVFGPGAIGYAQDAIGESDLESDRDILAGDSVITYRRRFILHPRGIKWKGTPAGAFPSRAELAIGTNWERVYENKQIRIVQFKHKIA